MVSDWEIFPISIKLLAELIVFIAICYIVGESSHDPLDSHVIENLNDYFYYLPNNTNSLDNKCECNNETLNHSCNEENISQGCLNISFNFEYQHLGIRKLESSSFCKDMQESFIRNQGRKLSYIFSINYKVIRKLSISILVVTVSFIILYGITSISNYIIKKINKNLADNKVKEKEYKTNETKETVYKEDRENRTDLKVIQKEEKYNDEKLRKICKIIVKVSKILITVAWIAKFVLSLLLYHFIEVGDNHKYEDFLDCRNVKKKYFDKFKGIKKLRESFTTFAIVSIISESLDKINDLIGILGELN